MTHICCFTQDGAWEVRYGAIGMKYFVSHKHNAT